MRYLLIQLIFYSQVCLSQVFNTSQVFIEDSDNFTIYDTKTEKLAYFTINFQADTLISISFDAKEKLTLRMTKSKVESEIIMSDRTEFVYDLEDFWITRSVKNPFLNDIFSLIHQNHIRIFLIYKKSKLEYSYTKEDFEGSDIIVIEEKVIEPSHFVGLKIESLRKTITFFE